MLATILVVEDHEDIRELLVRLLEHAGYRVYAARDGAEGVQMAQSCDPALILMDINMPEMNGFTATTKIRQNAGEKRVPIIALTAYSLAGDKARATAAGCDDFHPKPLEMDRLLEQIRAFLAK